MRYFEDLQNHKYISIQFILLGQGLQKKLPSFTWTERNVV